MPAHHRNSSPPGGAVDDLSLGLDPASERPTGPRLIIASELRLLRDGLAEALARDGKVRVLAVVADVQSARTAVHDHQPDVLLLDVAVEDSLALARELAATTGVRVIAFAVADDEHNLFACIEAGVAGYIARDGALEDVVAAVRSVGRGETICSPRLAASLFRRLAALERERRSTMIYDEHEVDLISLLSPREREILSFLDQGLTNKQIASRLRIEVATVKNHVHRILEKLQVARRGEAVARARARSFGRLPLRHPA